MASATSDQYNKEFETNSVKRDSNKVKRNSEFSIASTSTNSRVSQLGYY